MSNPLELTVIECAADEQLLCDGCDKDLANQPCWTAEAAGYGAAGVIVLCGDCRWVWSEIVTFTIRQGD